MSPAAERPILLVVPFRHANGHDLGLGYLATAVRNAGYPVKLRELYPAGITPEQFGEMIRHEQPRVLGIKVWTLARDLVRTYLAAALRADPELPVLLGGPHVSGMGTQILDEFPEATYAMAGEAEVGLPLLLDEMLRKGRDRLTVLDDIPGLVWRRRGEAVANPWAYVEDLDQLGDPAWDGFDFERYHGYERRSTAMDYLPFCWVHISPTRGCPGHCTFCANLGGPQRRHSPAVIVEQLRELRDRHGVRHFGFADDNLTADPEYARALFDAIAPLGLTWDCMSNGLDIQTLDADLVRSMIRSGCQGLSLGVESGSDHLLKQMGKKHRQRDIHEGLARIRGGGEVWINAFLLNGFPGETDRDALKTLRLLAQIDVDTFHISMYKHTPGTPISKKLEREGRRPDPAPDQWWYLVPSTPTDTIPLWRLEWYFLLDHIVFCARPSRLWRTLQRLGPARLLAQIALMIQRIALPACSPTKSFDIEQRLARLEP